MVATAAAIRVAPSGPIAGGIKKAFKVEFQIGDFSVAANTVSYVGQSGGMEDVKAGDTVIINSANGALPTGLTVSGIGAAADGSISFAISNVTGAPVNWVGAATPLTATILRF